MAGDRFFSRPVSALPGVGKVKEGQLARLGIETVRDLLYHFPRGYQNRGDVRTLAEAAMSGECCATVLTVGTVPAAVRLPHGKTLSKFTCFDETGKCTVLFFNASFVRQIFSPGLTFRFWGKVQRSKTGRGWEMISPAFEQYFEQIPLPDFLPVYPLTDGLKQKQLAAIIGVALMQLQAEGSGEGYDPIPEEIRRRRGLLSLREALFAIHRPQDYAELEKARNRFIFEEFFLFSLSMAGSAAKDAVAYPVFADTDLTAFARALPFSLTGAQKRCIGEIAADLAGAKNRPMKRLAAGDVGSGKTVLAAAAAYLAFRNGCQSALMVPTEILADQHYKELRTLLGGLGMRVALLTGSMTASEKRAIRAKTADGGIDLLIGTHAILTKDTVFSSLGLVITDEQHRFGVMQRAGLSGKGQAVHTLVMTATPIPRTLALILYRDLDISRIDELPPGRQKVDTFLVDDSYRARLYAFIRKQAQNGHQTYIVCPAVEEQDDDGEDDDFPEDGIVGIDYHPDRGEKPSALPLRGAVEYADRLAGDVFPDLRIALLHGRMKGKDKDAVMARFAAHEIDVLVSTTVIEVGVNVPNATLMIVENAERFGLSQLHQLRGRVGRGESKSYCVLLSNAPAGSTARERLEVLRDHTDGYAIAEADLRQRGPGDFLPTASGEARQHGNISFRMAGLCENTDLLRDAAEEAFSLIGEDPSLCAEDHALARDAAAREYAASTGMMN